MKSATIQRTLVEQAATFLLALPHKEPNLSTQDKRDRSQPDKIIRDEE
jgi:hypothetical protein